MEIKLPLPCLAPRGRYPPIPSSPGQTTPVFTFETRHSKPEITYMGRHLENLEQFGIDVVLERRRGFRASILRGILYALSFVYEWLVQLRFFLYREKIFRELPLRCLVIIIRNLTLGGAGTTPVP